jgi:CHRD domain
MLSSKSGKGGKMYKNICIRMGLLLVGLVVGSLLLAACGSGKTALNTNKHKASLGSNIVMANAALYHSPQGTVDLAWSASTRQLSVKISVLGMAPKTVHPVDIHSGMCRQPGAIKYVLASLVANVSGVANSTTTLTNVAGGIPQNSWSVDVHNGASAHPGLQQLVISCADVQIVSPKVQGQSDQHVHAVLGAAYAPNQQASGVAQLRLVDNSLTVTVTMTGLAPKSAHMAYIYSGACQTQGQVIYSLKPITADNQGNGTSTTVLNGVSQVPYRGWYVNVHLTGDPAAQMGNSPIACGNVRTAQG